MKRTSAIDIIATEAYGEKKLKKLTKLQQQIIFETLRNDTSLKGDEIMKFRRILRLKKVI